MLALEAITIRDGGYELHAVAGREALGPGPQLLDLARDLMSQDARGHDVVMAEAQDFDVGTARSTGANA
jgi:hypothetical protein